MTVTHDMLMKAYEKYTAAMLDTTLLSLRALGEMAREQAPDAQTIQLDWSDQGPFLGVTRLLTADGTDIGDDFEDDCVAWNLGENCQSQWEGYLVDSSTGGPVTRRTQLMSLDVDKALAIEIPPEYLDG